MNDKFIKSKNFLFSSGIFMFGGVNFIFILLLDKDLITILCVNLFFIPFLYYFTSKSFYRIVFYEKTLTITFPFKIINKKIEINYLNIVSVKYSGTTRVIYLIIYLSNKNYIEIIDMSHGEYFELKKTILSKNPDVKFL